MRDLLDDLICGLGKSDRDAVVLRFFSKRTYLEIAEAQGTTDEGARKRVGRALEKLRRKLAESGVTSSTQALESVLTKQPDHEAPQKLADRVAGIALAEFGATGAATSWLLSLARVLTSKAATLGAVLVATALLVAWQHHKNILLGARIARLDGQAEQIRTIERENRRLSHSVFEAEDLRRTLAEIPTRLPGSNGGTASARGAGKPLNINVTAEGTIAWGDEPVTLQEFLDRLVASHAQDPSSHSQIVVNGSPGAAFSATAYIVEQANKAGFHDIVINSPSSPGTKDNWVTMDAASIPPGGIAPPTLPDVTLR